MGGGMADKMFPGWQEKLWARYPQGYKEYVVKSENDKFEAGIAQHKWWQGLLLSYKSMEASFKPSAKYRKPGVDWRRQIERVTMLRPMVRGTERQRLPSWKYLRSAGERPGAVHARGVGVTKAISFVRLDEVRLRVARHLHLLPSYERVACGVV